MSNKETKFKIWNCVRLVKYANIHEISATLNLPNIEVISMVYELQKENYIKLIAVPMDVSSVCGSYYAATGKEFV